MNHLTKIIILLFVVISGCREKYVPNVVEPVTGYLVVDGFINSGGGATVITLSRTTKLSNTALIAREAKALVRVEGKLNTSFVLTETSTPGIYSNITTTLNPNDQYRLYIKTAGGKEYASEYSVVRRTPDMDSVAWRQESDGVRIYGNTHNTQLPVGYYQFKFEETWEIRSSYTTRLKVIFNASGAATRVDYRDPITHADDLSFYFCWKTDTAKNILVTSTEKLTQNTISMFPMRYIPSNSWELAVRYSMLAKVYSISRDNMKFLEQLKKNTEQLGSIFDAQPSDNIGNVRNLLSPSEIVIGFIEVSEEKTKRIFIDNSQLNQWRFVLQGCLPPDSSWNNPPGPTLGPIHGIPTQPTKISLTGNIDSFQTAPAVCVDCTIRGSNKKPSFW
jgi:hypothetical protein